MNEGENLWQGFDAEGIASLCTDTIENESRI